MNYEKLYKIKCEENKTLLKQIETLEKKIALLETAKGSQCSKNGNKYEKYVHDIVKNVFLNNKSFNNQCHKEFNAPDWVQCGIIYNTDEQRWEPGKKNKLPEKIRKFFKDIVNETELFKGQLPPFLYQNLTYDEWLEIKNQTLLWDDFYIDIPRSTIRNMYKHKGCSYIQLSNGYGLYHLGEDICNFEVPLFSVEQRIRGRIKVHSRKNKRGFCNLSVTLACQPKNITSLQPSKYSLDDISKLPKNLVHIPK